MEYFTGTIISIISSLLMDILGCFHLFFLLRLQDIDFLFAKIWRRQEAA